MGIIEKQAAKNAIYFYLGARLGFITVIWFSHAVTIDENGLIRILVSMSTLLAQVSSLGFSAVIIISVYSHIFVTKNKGIMVFYFMPLSFP